MSASMMWVRAAGSGARASTECRCSLSVVSGHYKTAATRTERVATEGHKQGSHLFRFQTSFQPPSHPPSHPPSPTHPPPLPSQPSSPPSFQPPLPGTTTLYLCLKPRPIVSAKRRSKRSQVSQATDVTASSAPLLYVPDDAPSAVGDGVAAVEVVTASRGDQLSVTDQPTLGDQQPQMDVSSQQAAVVEQPPVTVDQPPVTDQPPATDSQPPTDVSPVVDEPPAVDTSVPAEQPPSTDQLPAEDKSSPAFVNYVGA